MEELLHKYRQLTLLRQVRVLHALCRLQPAQSADAAL
jgi:hypothetical protein